MNQPITVTGEILASTNPTFTKRIQWSAVVDEPQVAVGQCIPVTIAEATRSRPQNLPGYVRLGAKLPPYGTWCAEMSINEVDWFRPVSSYVENGEVFLIIGGWVRSTQEDKWFVRVRRIA